MGRKFLEEIGAYPIGDVYADHPTMSEVWEKERGEYGFDSRDTWHLNISMLELLYERVKLFKEKASHAKKEDLNIVKVGSENIPFSKVVEEIIELSEKVLTYNGEDVSMFYKEDYNRQRRVWELWMAGFQYFNW